MWVITWAPGHLDFMSLSPSTRGLRTVSHPPPQHHRTGRNTALEIRNCFKGNPTQRNVSEKVNKKKGPSFRESTETKPLRSRSPGTRFSNPVVIALQTLSVRRSSIHREVARTPAAPAPARIAAHWPAPSGDAERRRAGAAGGKTLRAGVPGVRERTPRAQPWRREEPAELARRATGVKPKWKGGKGAGSHAGSERGGSGGLLSTWTPPLQEEEGSLAGERAPPRAPLKVFADGSGV